MSGENSTMSRRVAFCLQLLLLFLGVLGGTCRAQRMYLCVGSSSTNFQGGDFVACGSNAAEILSFSFGASAPVNVRGGTLATGNVAVSQFSIEKVVGQLSTLFASSLFSGGSLGSSLAFGVNTPAPGGTQNVTITLTNPKVVSFAQSGASEQPIESVSISYSAITITDNTTTPATTVTW
jgi:type VI protein secretion system component Hcp